VSIFQFHHAESQLYIHNNAAHLRYIANAIYTVQFLLLALLFATNNAVGEIVTNEEAMTRRLTDKTVDIKPSVLARFKVEEIDYPIWKYDREENKLYTQISRFPFRLHIPEHIEEETKYPLILWLHGCGDERGWDNASQLQYVEKTLLRGRPREAPYFIMIPQCPLIPGKWYRGPADPVSRTAPQYRDEMLPIVIEMLDAVIAKYPVDTERITVVGISCAAQACLEIGVRYPNRWAALAPMSLNSIPAEHAGVLPPCPIWAFVNDHDSYMSQEKISKLQHLVDIACQRGANFYVTRIKDENWKHDTWHPAFNDFEVLDWILLQQRNRSRWRYPPGVRPSQWPLIHPLPGWTMKQLIGQVTVVCILLGVPTYFWHRRFLFKIVKSSWISR
jgi:hypothetical protein